MELFRFRVVRPVLSQPSDGLDVTSMFEPAVDAAELRNAANNFANQAPAADVAAIGKWLAKFSSQLALHGDLFSPKQCIDLLPDDWLISGCGGERHACRDRSSAAPSGSCRGSRADHGCRDHL
jgi:hypothetical protein